MMYGNIDSSNIKLMYLDVDGTEHEMKAIPIEVDSITEEVLKNIKNTTELTINCSIKIPSEINKQIKLIQYHTKIINKLLIKIDKRFHKKITNKKLKYFRKRKGVIRYEFMDKKSR